MLELIPADPSNANDCSIATNDFPGLGSLHQHLNTKCMMVILAFIKPNRLGVTSQFN